jgi:hypothetical protein
MAYGGITSWREYLSFRRLVVTLGVAGTMGIVEWIGLGHPIGLVVGLFMGALALVAAPLPWLWILPWGLRRPPLAIFLRAMTVLALSAALVVVAYLVFFAIRDHLIPARHPLVGTALPHLSAWSSMVISIPLFAAAGWGLSRHLELERRLEVHDARELALRSALDEARLLALQSRLDPHFLFNALNLVAELCQEDPAEAERCVLRLSALLRAALDHAQQPLIPLGRELELCVDYLELCRARFGDRLRVEISRDPGADSCRIPFLAVQVLCENAVRHGIERQAEGGVVRIETARDRHEVRIRVYSPGPFGGERPGGVGLALTRERLFLAYREKSRLEISTTEAGSGTLAEITLPAEGSPVSEYQEPSKGSPSTERMP